MRAVFGVVIVGLVLAVFAAFHRAPAAEDTGGYYILALSWTPSWCAHEGDDRKDDRCARGTGAGWLVHGLWPQNRDGTWPEFCDTPHPPASRAQTARMVDIMGSAGLAWHQWRKHGTCSGLRPEAYFDATRRAFRALDLPPAPHMQQNRQVTPAALIAAVQQANPSVQDDMAFMTCHSGNVQELRLCLDRDLRPGQCDPRTLQRACRARTVTMPAVR
ncbi:ribonuclease T2 family protein [Roseinatronobacter sp. NSM]|uniref:ribonuclease T2 family protein n=1 Tax=Roseinatronobacter sp. NSM TaxID=3457785 RepID=UPI0040371BBD